MSKKTLDPIEIEDTGAIVKAVIPAPTSGGVVRLRAKNGAGKTTALNAINTALSGSGSLPVRDGAKMAKFEGLGITLKVGRTTRRSGELEVESISGKLDIGELIDPGFAKGDANDARRIKQLLHLGNVVPDSSAFHSLAGGPEKFKEIADEKTIAAGDIVLMAERLKRDFEAAARKKESTVQQLIGQEFALREQAGEVSREEPHDLEALRKAHADAIRVHASLEGRFQQCATAAAEAEKARARLAEIDAGANAAIPTPEEAEAKLGEAADNLDSLKRQLERYQRLVATAQRDHGLAKAAADVARKHAELVAGLKAQASAKVAGPSQADLLEAANHRDAAAAAVERGAVVRDALDKLDKADEVKRQAVAITKEAEALRGAAGAVDETLSSLLSKVCDRLQVEAGRLVLETERGKTFFNDLSPGERARIAVDIAVESLGEGAVVVLKQEAWESLDPHNRRAIDKAARERRLLIYTAEPSDDPQITTAVGAE